MSIRSRFIAAVVALFGAFALLAGAASADPPVRVENCELIIEVAGNTVAVCICQNGPPI